MVIINQDAYHAAKLIFNWSGLLVKGTGIVNYFAKELLNPFRNHFQAKMIGERGRATEDLQVSLGVLIHYGRQYSTMITGQY